MQITLYKDLKKYALTSSLTKEDILLVKKYRPEALKKQDKDGNDIFAVSYSEGHPCVAANGVTFGGATADGGLAFITGEIPADMNAEKAGEYVADKVGPALAGINEFEAKIPEVVAAIKAERGALIAGIKSV